jgi:hypothetical protein
MLKIILTLLFIASLGYNIYVKTTEAMVLVFITAAVGIIYTIYSSKKTNKQTH